MQLDLLPVVGLLDPRTTGVRPVVEPVAGVGRGHRHLVGRPEPSVDVLGLEVWTITTIEVTKSSGSPDILDS